VSTAVLAIMITGLVRVAAGSFERGQSGREYGTATFYATEGTEIVRGIAARDFSALTDGPHGITQGAGGFSFAGVSDTFVSGSVTFTRVITVTAAKRNASNRLVEDGTGTADAKTKKVTATVSWNPGNAPRTVTYTIRTYVTNWREL
jgi:hypothetical protein